jgi:hypothetical protein
MTEAEVTRNIMDRVYSAREQIYEETKHLSASEYVAYFSDHVRAIIERNGYLAVRSNDGLGYTLQKRNG